jgi:hypothetical protein
VGQPWRVTTIEEPLILRVLPGYEPKPGPSPHRFGRHRLRLVEDRPDRPPADDVAPALCSRLWHLINQVLEAIDGRRPLGQLRPHFTATALSSIETRAKGRTTQTRSRLRSLHARQPADGVVEACGVAEIDDRRRAVAARFEVREPLRCSVFRVL